MKGLKPEVFSDIIKMLNTVKKNPDSGLINIAYLSKTKFTKRLINIARKHLLINCNVNHWGYSYTISTNGLKLLQRKCSQN